MLSFIESQFPVSRVSKESYKERKSNYSQTLTGLGKWWGRKPLVLCRATIIGLLMPATEDAEADRACFLAIMTMDEAGLLRRFKGINPKGKVLELATGEELREYTALEDHWKNATTPEQKRERKAELAEAFKALELAVFSRLPYDEQIALCDRPEQIDGPSPESWEKINAHLGTSAASIPELVAQLGQKRFGRVPRVGDAFCGGGSIPFEAARIGCEAYASDLNPVAALLTWSALNIVGGGPEVAAQVRKAQEGIYAAVDSQVCQWGIEHKTEDLPAAEWEAISQKLASGTLTPAQLDETLWRADAYLYCVEVRCPETGWMVPLAPSWVIGEKTKAIAVLIPLPEEKRYRIEIRSGVSAAEMKAAKTGTIAKGKISHPVLLQQGLAPGTIEQARQASRRAAPVADSSHHPNGLRLWENDDLVPRPDDVFQERLYCVRWVETYRNKKGEIRTRKHYRETTSADLAREEKALALLRDRFADWQQQGFLPSMKIEPGYNTDQPIRERGWTHWHHLFNPRQLLTHGKILEVGIAQNVGNKIASVFSALWVATLGNRNSRLVSWVPSHGVETTDQVFVNQALNTKYNTAARGIRGFQSVTSISESAACATKTLVETNDSRLSEAVCDFWVTDPPYADAINYHELSDFFLSWHTALLREVFPNWARDNRRALAVVGSDEAFRNSMVDCYKNLAAHMPEDGMQVVMFTHQDAAVWADLALILWASGLRVTAAWCIATETDSALKAGNYVQGTVLLILRKQTSGDIAFLDEVYPEVEDEVKRQLDAMHELDDPHADAPDFGDTDYQLAAYAAALRVLTRYKAIEDIDVTRELSRPRTRNAPPSPLEAAISEAVRIACDHLVPPGIDRSVWRALSPAERFFLKGLDLESRGEQRSGAYMELARGFGLREYSDFLSSERANEVRLHTATSLGKKHMRGEPGEFASSLLRHTLFAIREVAKADAGAEPGRLWLANEVPNYWGNRKTLIALLNYLAKFAQSLESWKADSQAAKLLAGALENDN